MKKFHIHIRWIYRKAIWFAHVIELEGCCAEATTQAQVRAKIRDAITLFLPKNEKYLTMETISVDNGKDKESYSNFYL